MEQDGAKRKVKAETGAAEKNHGRFRGFDVGALSLIFVLLL